MYGEHKVDVEVMSRNANVSNFRSVGFFCSFIINSHQWTSGKSLQSFQNGNFYLSSFFIMLKLKNRNETYEILF